MPYYTITFKSSEGRVIRKEVGSWTDPSEAHAYAESITRVYRYPPGEWFELPADCTHIIKENHNAERQHNLHKAWAEKWRAARKNMPATAKNRSGQATALCMILGYKIHNNKDQVKSDKPPVRKWNRAGNTIYHNTSRGSIPRNPKTREALEKLAGPYGAVLAKGWFDQRGIKWKYYPALGI